MTRLNGIALACGTFVLSHIVELQPFSKQ